MEERDSEHVNREHERGGRREAPSEGDGANQPAQEGGIEPRRPETMPRAEDDAATFANSPEFHDRMPPGD